MHAIHQAGPSIPNDVAVVSYDNIDAAAFYHPPPTTNRYTGEEEASSAAQQLFAVLEAQSFRQACPANTIILVAVDLAQYQSIGPERIF